MNRYSGRHTLFHVGIFMAPMIPLALLTGLYSYPNYHVTMLDFVILWATGLATSYALVAVHELGHVLGGWLVGIKVSMIAIGTWRKWASFRIRNVSVVLRAASGFGFVRPRKAIHSLPLWKIAIFLFAGLTAEVVVLVATLRLEAPADLNSFTDALIEYFRLCVIWAVAVHFLYNLPPSHGPASLELATDGTQFLWHWQARSGRRPDRVLFVQKQELSELWMDGQKARALETAQALLEKHPEDIELRKYTASFLAETGKTYEAEGMWRNMLKEPLGALRLAEALDCLCCLALYHGRMDLLKEADGWSTEALNYAPNAITLKGTRGSLLVELGRIDEAVTMLLDVLAKTDCPVDEVISSAYLAKACWLTGDTLKAEEYMKEAEKIDPRHAVVRMIRAQIRSPRLIADANLAPAT